MQTAQSWGTWRWTGVAQPVQTRGVKNARYYWADSNSVITLVDYELARHVFAAPNTPEGTKRAFAIADLADRTAWEVWANAREGTDAYANSR